MGLDMYLTMQTSIDNYKHEPEGQRLANDIMDLLNIAPDFYARRFGSIEVNIPAAYWRKANAIHGWFVNHVQDGVDDCKQYSVDVSQLEELRDLCASILQGKTERESLPPTSGFFFGDSSYGDDYTEDLEHTVAMLTYVLATPQAQNAYFYYQASW